jgi:hypothetical protein
MQLKGMTITAQGADLSGGFARTTTRSDGRSLDHRFLFDLFSALCTLLDCVILVPPLIPRSYRTWTVCGDKTGTVYAPTRGRISAFLTVPRKLSLVVRAVSVSSEPQSLDGVVGGEFIEFNCAGKGCRANPNFELYFQS